jgi:hypothetical protein
MKDQKKKFPELMKVLSFQDIIENKKIKMLIFRKSVE